MEFDWAAFAGAFMMTLFLGAVLAVIAAKLLRASNRVAWAAGAVLSLILGAVGGLAAGVAAAIIFAVLAILNKPLPKFS